MTILFTQQQRKDATLKQVSIPAENANLAVAQASTTADKELAEGQDSVKKEYFDESIRIADAYQQERQHLNGLKFSNILESHIDDAAQEKPTSELLPKDGSYLEKFPKVIVEFNGKPVTPNESIIEETPIDDMLLWIDHLKNGYSDGAATTTTLEAYDPVGTDVDDITGFSVGNRTLVYDSSGCVWATLLSATAGDPLAGFCTGETTPPQLTQAACEGDGGTWTPTPTEDALAFNQPEIVESGTPGIGATVQNFHNGFNNTERQNAGSGDLQPYFNYIAGLITTHVNTWKTKLTAQKTQLEANEEKRATEASQVQAALADVNNAIAIIDAWLAKPNSGIGNKWEDNGLDPLINEGNARLTFIPDRITEITDALGQVDVVDPLGSSSGIYGEIYKISDMRCNLAIGTLTKVYRFDAGLDTLQDFVDNNNNTKAMYDSDFRSQAFAKNADGSLFILVTDSAGFANSDSVFIISQDQPELVRTIVNITTVMIGVDTFKQIELNAIVSAAYTVAKVARIVKEL